MYTAPLDERNPMNLVDLAIATALEYHHGQLNTHSDEPYILHPQRVALHVRDRGLDESHQAVAWLHDALEDTTLTVATLNRLFEPDVVAAIVALTKTKGESNEEYYTNLTFNHMAARVKVSDIIDNFSRNHLIESDATRLRMAAKYSLGLDILKEFV
jgi:(p)ppGpp synthase/HD superfamily hydrolase